MIGYNVFNMQADYEISAGLSISLAANNIFNRYYLPASSQWGGVVVGRSPAGEGANARLTATYNF